MHKAILIATVLTIACLPFVLRAQSLQLEWVAEYPCYSPAALEYDKVETDENQNVFLFGAAVSDISPFFNGSAIMTQKYDSTGALLWEAQLDGQFGDQFYTSVIGYDNHVVVGGRRYSMPGSLPGRAEVAKYDYENGSELWLNYIFDTIQQGANLVDLDMDNNENIFACGVVSSYSNGVYGPNKMFLAKVNYFSGETVWGRISDDKVSAIKVRFFDDKVRVYGTKQVGQFNYINVITEFDVDGNELSTIQLPVISYGPQIFESYFFFDEQGHLITFGYKVYKFGMSDTPLWAFDFARGLPNMIGQARNAKVDDEGNVYATGYLKDTITTEEFTQTIKLSPVGELVWAKVDKFSDDTDFERGQEIAVSPEHVFVSSMIAYSTPTGPAAQKLDYRPILYSQADGSILYDTLIDVNFHDFHDYAYYGKGHFYLLGRSYYPSSSDPDDYKYQLFKFGVEGASGVAGQPVGEYLVEVFPNPANSNLTISQQGKQHFDKAMLFDVQGRQVFAAALTSQVQVLQLSDLVAGVYSLELKGSHVAITRKVVVQR